MLVTFGQICNFRDPNLVTFYFYELTHLLDWMNNTLLFICSTNIQPSVVIARVLNKKKEIPEITGFVGIFWKNKVQEAYLPKMNISGQIVSGIVAQLSLENSIKTLLNFFGSTLKKIRRVCMEFSEYNRVTSQRQFAPKCSFLVRRPLGHYSFRISWQIP